MVRKLYIGPLSLSFFGPADLVSHMTEDAFSEKPEWKCEDYIIDLKEMDTIQMEGIPVFDRDGVQVVSSHNDERRYYYVPGDLYKRLNVCSWQIEKTVHLILRKGVLHHQYYNYIGLEHLLLSRNAIVLHSASVIYQSKAILFSAPSGTGKSTQADLWKKHRNAVGFNGDRNLLWKKDGRWMVAGLPWHGTSPDCLNACVPLRTIVVLRQAKTDQTRILSPAEKTLALFSEATINRWNQEDQEIAFSLIDALCQETDIVGLDCTMSPSAVEVLETYLEGSTDGLAGG